MHSKQLVHYRCCGQILTGLKEGHLGHLFCSIITVYSFLPLELIIGKWTIYILISVENMNWLLVVWNSSYF